MSIPLNKMIFSILKLMGLSGSFVVSEERVEIKKIILENIYSSANKRRGLFY